MSDHDRFALALTTHAPLEHIVDAFLANQALWLERLATGELYPAANSPGIYRADTCRAVMTGGSGVVTSPARGALSTSERSDLDHLLGALRMDQARDILTWAPAPRTSLDIALLARGFDRGFEPEWMFRDLTTEIAPVDVDGISVDLATQNDVELLASSPTIPYVSDNVIGGARRLIDDPDRTAVRWLVAHDNDEVVGQAIVHVTGQVSGLFNVAVHPRWRGRGIGSALTASAIDFARTTGATTMTLNSTPDGRRLYQRAGFLPAGIGQTWFLPQQRTYYQVNPDEVTMAERIGAGELASRDRNRIPSVLPNGDTPVQFAAAFRQRRTVETLLTWGHPAEVIALWDVGLHDASIHAMSRTNERNRPSGPSRATPLHHAISRGDAELVRMLLEAGADLTRRDAQFNATPLGWAQHLGQSALANMIRAAGGR